MNFDTVLREHSPGTVPEAESTRATVDAPWGHSFDLSGLDGLTTAGKSGFTLYAMVDATRRDLKLPTEVRP